MDGALRAVGRVDDHVGLVPFIGDGQQPHPRVPPPTQCRRDIGQPVAGLEHLRADQVGGQIAVAEAEPVGVGAVGGELFLRMPRLVPPPPGAFFVDAAAERIHAGVEIGADPNAMHPGIVADVDDGADGMLRIVIPRFVAGWGSGIGERGAAEQLAHSE